MREKSSRRAPGCSSTPGRVAEAGSQSTDSAVGAATRIVRSLVRGEGLPAYVPDLIRRVTRVVVLTFQRSRLGRWVAPGYHSARRRLRQARADGHAPRSLVFSHGRWQVAVQPGASTIEPIRLSNHLVLPPQPRVPDAGGDPPFDVDAVFTWVDGTDPAWVDAFSRTARDLDGDDHGPLAANASRYRDRGELRAALDGLALYAPWIRRVFLVTAGQVPRWLEPDGVVLVDHREILPIDDLPTFNSHAIEAALHRIEGLAEHWIYFNDDVLLGRSVDPADFFSGQGVLKLFPDPSAPIGSTSAAPVDRAARLTREVVEELTGGSVGHKLRHAPHPQLRSVADELESVIPGRLAKTRASRFRSVDDVSLPSSLAPRYAEATGRGVPADLDVEYINIASRWARLQMREFDLMRHRTVVCLNETAVSERKERGVARRVERFLDEAFPRPST